MGSKKLLDEVRMQALEMLKRRLPADLVYHNFEHTVDVMNAAERIAKDENITSDDIEVLKLAAALHDSGYIIARANHEEESCRIAQELLSTNGVDKNDIDKVCELIRATKIPHNVKNKLSEILCDADLDYLGREDFFTISRKVFNEFKTFNVVKDEDDFNQLQIRFFESHKYFTPTAKKLREGKKMEHLEMLKSLVGNKG